MEVLFYHLQSRSLEHALPPLLEKTLQRGWRAVVQVASAERLAALDAHLWTYSDDSFLPHAPEADGDDAPIRLSLSDARPADAAVIFCVDGVGLPTSEGWQRAVLMFDGNDADALQSARSSWRMGKDKGLAMTYWQQDEAGRWAQRS